MIHNEVRGATLGQMGGAHYIKILDRLRFSPPPRDPRRRQRKNAILVLQSAFSNDLCGHVGDFRRAAGVDVEIFGF